ncbi:N-acetylmuramoyl-L-alanine amidase [Halorubellus salinus]|uniref:N-acetylmuramoyl-L-alanine amidase n=1 Tax=Halorubellus salinus TaxID=755309 RepID=UPI001D065BF3|nr:N-acetylmuramoyl-L-alanine amidase [Halorubellus salinus]
MEYVSAHDSNYASASRDASDLRWIVVHTIEGSASSGINWFQNPDANVSSHFVVDENGQITQLVDLDDVAWTQENGPYSGPTLAGMNVYYATDDRWDVESAGHYRTLAENVRAAENTRDARRRVQDGME